MPRTKTSGDVPSAPAFPGPSKPSSCTACDQPARPHPHLAQYPKATTHIISQEDGESNLHLHRITCNLRSLPAPCTTTSPPPVPPVSSSLGPTVTTTILLGQLFVPYLHHIACYLPSSF